MREAFQRAAIDADDLVVHFQASISVVRRKRGREGEREKEGRGRDGEGRVERKGGGGGERRGGKRGKRLEEAVLQETRSLSYIRNPDHGRTPTLEQREGKRENQLKNLYCTFSLQAYKD